MMDLKEAQKTWAVWKYFVMSRSQQEYLAIRRLFSNNQWSSSKGTELAQRLERVATLAPTLQTLRNTYEHVWGYFKQVASEEEKAVFFERLEVLSLTQDEALPYLRFLTQKYQIPYLLESKLLEEK